MENWINYKVIGLGDISKLRFDANKLETLNWNEISIVEILSIPHTKIKVEEINEVKVNIDLGCIKLIETPYRKKLYEVALLDSNGNVVYVDGKVKSCPCCKTFTLEPNSEGVCLSGRKLTVLGILKQQIIYTGDVISQSVHLLEVENPFSTYITVYAKFKGTTPLVTDIVAVDPLDDTKTIIIDGYLYIEDGPIEVDLCEDFCVDTCIEDIFVKLLDNENIFKSITLILSASPYLNK